MIQRTTARQEAELATRGVKESSGSFQAIKSDTYNVGSRELRNLDVTKSLLEQNTEIEKRNVQDTLFAQMYGNISDVSTSDYKLRTA